MLLKLEWNEFPNGRCMSEPDSFFYYTSLADQLRKAWVKEILIEHRVYFRSRENLNDPGELRPKSILQGPDKAKRAYFRRLVDQFNLGNLSPARRLLEADRMFRRYQRVGMPQDLLHKELGKIGVFCLSETVTDNQLWSHYADGHRGVAIEFDAGAGLFVTAQKVLYVKSEPVINRLVDGDTILEKSVLTKSEDWQYEREWRVMARPQHHSDLTEKINILPKAVQEFLSSQHGSGHYSIPADSIRSVTLGARCSPDDAAWIRSVISEGRESVQLKRAEFAFGNVTIAP